MPRPKNTPKTGGRKKGSPNKKTLLRRQIETGEQNALLLETLRALPFNELIQRVPTDYLDEIVQKRRAAERCEAILEQARAAERAKDWERAALLSRQGLESNPSDFRFVTIRFNALLSMPTQTGAYEFIDAHLPMIWGYPTSLAEILYLLVEGTTPQCSEQTELAKKLSERILVLVPLGKAYEYAWYVYFPVAEYLFESGDVIKAVQLNSVASALVPEEHKVAFQDYIQNAQAEYRADIEKKLKANSSSAV